MTEQELQALDNTIMPIGPHKGEMFKEIPLKALDSLLGWPKLRDPLKSKLEKYLSHPRIAAELDKELNK